MAVVWGGFEACFVLLIFLSIRYETTTFEKNIFAGIIILIMQLNLKLDIKDDIPSFLFSNRTPVVLKNLPSNYIVADIETTGFSAQKDAIIEISALKVMNDEVVAEFSSLINPKRSISSFISNLTGITSDMLNNAPDLQVVLKDFCNFVELHPIIGHNIRFDLSFINKNLNDLYNKTLKNDCADTLFFAKKAYPSLSSYKLTNIAKHLNIDTTNAHRALSDCRMTFSIIKDIKDKENLTIS